MSEIKIFETENEEIQVTLGKETVWLTQRQMGDIFETTPENILMHLNNIYDYQELKKDSTTKNFLVVQTEGKRQVKRNLQHYNLDAIISVGYRVNSKKGVKFRQWATRILKEHLTKGYTLNQQRFEQNAKELEAALALIKKAAKSPVVTAVAGVIHMCNRENGQ